MFSFTDIQDFSSMCHRGIKDGYVINLSVTQQHV